MEQETISTEESQIVKTSKLNTVTPFSKYLAMGLFVVLPFLGGWIGYVNAPEKVVEVERIVMLEKETITDTATTTKLESSNSQDETIEAQSNSSEESPQEILEEHFPTLADVNVGDPAGAFTVTTIEVGTFTPFFGGPNREPYVLEKGRHTALVSLDGTTSLSGIVYMVPSHSEGGMTAGTPFYIAFKPTPSEIEKLPYIEGFTTAGQHGQITVEGLENHPFVLSTLDATGCSTDDEKCQTIALWNKPAESDELEIAISGFKLYNQTWPSGRPSFPETKLVE